MWALLHIILGVIEHFGPVIPLIDDLVSEGAGSRMIPKIFVMDFPHYSLSFVWIETSQIQVGVETIVGFLV